VQRRKKGVDGGGGKRGEREGKERYPGLHNFVLFDSGVTWPAIR